MLPPNSYSPTWFDLFHVAIPEERTRKETDFICAIGPLPDYRKVLDVCCGMGRHARTLAERGYSVTGVERDGAAVAKARELGGGPHYIAVDIREYQPCGVPYDLVIVMAQSFGYFDPATNGELLRRWAAGTRAAGRIILDVWSHAFFASRQGERELQTAAGVVLEKKHIVGDRLFVELVYRTGTHEEFEWQLFTAAEMSSLANKAGLELVVSCTDFNVAAEPTADNPRVQFVLERPSPLDH